MLDESRAEVSYKLKDLNQRIAAQAAYPLNCLKS